MTDEFLVFSGSAEALVLSGGKIKHILIVYLLNNELSKIIKIA